MPSRRIALTREGRVFRLAFAYDPEVVSVVRDLPFAAFDSTTKTWTVTACRASRDELVRLHRLGWVDVDPDELVDGDGLPDLRPAVLRAGTVARPFTVQLARRDDTVYARFNGISGARWDKATRTLTYPPAAAAALAEQVQHGVLDDPGRLLTAHAVTVQYDPRTGAFVVRGDDRAGDVFAMSFPDRDPVSIWQGKGLDVGFSDPFSEEMYRGEIARRHHRVQPEGMALNLYDYQQADVALALEREGLLVAHGPGVGKTAIAIGTGHELLNRGQIPRVVAIIPAALRTQWRDEIVRFRGCDPDDVVVIAGDKRKRMAAWERAGDARWVLVHYQAVILPDDQKHLERLCPGALLVLDECHRVKSHQAKSTKVIQKLARKASRRLGLSGTPVENQPGEWYNVLSLLIPGIFGTPTDFLNRYSFPAPFGGFEGARNLPELRQRSKALYVRRTLSEVAEHLPRQRVQTIVLEPKPEYAAALRRAHADAKQEIIAARMASPRIADNVLNGNDVDEIAVAADMTAVGLLRLLCSSPRLVSGSDAPSAVALTESGLIPDDDGPKLDVLRDMVGELHAAGDRAVVFTSSKRMAYLVAERLDADGVPSVLFTGDTKPADRDAAVVAFTTPATADQPGPTVFISTDAGAEGLNLGRCCRTLINLDLPWTPGRLAQRNARVRRVNSEQESFLVVNLTLARTIEVGLLRMVEHKADLADTILGETGGRSATTGRASNTNIYEDALANWEA